MIVLDQTRVRLT